MILSTASTEYVKVPVVGRVAGELADPTGDAVALAILGPTATPVDADWHDGDWETDADLGYLARTLVTAGDHSAGYYAVWVKITSSPEVIVRRAPQFIRIF